jgi:four helix bundle protein
MNTLQLRLVGFAVNIYQHIQGKKNDPILAVIADQLLRSSTSIGANYSEAQAASSFRDFHNKVRIALKELNETQFWLKFLMESGIDFADIKALFAESEELIRILSTICKKTDPAHKPQRLPPFFLS